MSETKIIKGTAVLVLTVDNNISIDERNDIYEEYLRTNDPEIFKTDEFEDTDTTIEAINYSEDYAIFNDNLYKLEKEDVTYDDPCVMYQDGVNPQTTLKFLVSFYTGSQCLGEVLQDTFNKEFPTN